MRARQDIVFSMTASPLKAFLEHPARPAGTLSYHELQGFLFTIASAPELVPPSEWMPIIFDENEAGYATLDEAKEIVGELMTLYNDVNASVVEDRVALPTDCAFRDGVLANLEDSAPIAQWSRGFLRGHQWLEELWNAYVPKKLDDEFSAALLTLTFFASKELAEAFHAEAGNKERSLEAMASMIRDVFPEAIAEYAHLGRSIHLALLEAVAEPRRSVKIGRNGACPCGSGRKYKKCCGAPA